MFLTDINGFVYQKKPSFTFSFQDPDEQIVLVLRAHPITQVGWMLKAIIFSLLPIVFSFFLNQVPLQISQLFFLIFLWYGFCLSYTLTKFYFWYFNLGVITNKKIVDIDCFNIMSTSSTATTIDNIEEVQKKTTGLLPTWFDYGNIFVQTAGEKPNIEFVDTPHPTQVVQVINNLIEKHGTRPNS